MTTENSQDIVELRPGQKINFVFDVEMTTPLGQKRMTEVKETLTYEQILETFSKNIEGAKKKRTAIVPVQAKEFNRFAALAQTGIEQGKWLNGAAVDQKKLAADVIVRIKSLPTELYSHVTVKAQNHLEAVAGSKLLKPEQKKEIKDFLAKFEEEESVG